MNIGKKIKKNRILMQNPSLLSPLGGLFVRSQTSTRGLERKHPQMLEVALQGQLPPHCTCFTTKMTVGRRTRQGLTQQGFELLKEIIFCLPIFPKKHELFFSPKIWIFRHSGVFLGIRKMRAPKVHAECTG